MDKKTSLYDKHITLGAKMIAFGDYLMPLFYSGVKSEHLNTRSHVSVFDVSHMGFIWVEGIDAVDFLNYITTNNIKKLYDSKIQYSCFINEDGGVVDDLLIYRFNQNRYLLIVNSSNIDSDLCFLNNHASSFNEIEIINDSINWSIIALQGPKSNNVLNDFINMYDLSINLDKLKYYHFIDLSSKKLGKIIISATGYTGSGGFEIYIKNDYSDILWDGLINLGKSNNIVPAGLAARDTLRLEKGFCLYGNDLDLSTTPIEANLNFVVDFDKEFLGKDVLLNQVKKGCSRKLISFSISDKGVPRKGYNLLNLDGKIIGQVTSGTMSPSMSIGIGLAYIDSAFVNKKCFIDIRGKHYLINFEKLPFYK